MQTVVKLFSSFCSLLRDLGEYPGLGFLKPLGKKGESIVSNYNSYVAEANYMKGEVEASRNKALSVGRTASSAAAKIDFKESPSEAAASPAPAGIVPHKSPSPSSESHGKAAPGSAGQPPATDSRGTLMVDSFMQTPEASAEMKQRWLDAAAQPRTSGQERVVQAGLLWNTCTACRRTFFRPLPARHDRPQGHGAFVRR